MPGGDVDLRWLENPLCVDIFLGKAWVFHIELLFYPMGNNFTDCARSNGWFWSQRYDPTKILVLVFWLHYRIDFRKSMMLYYHWLHTPSLGFSCFYFRSKTIVLVMVRCTTWRRKLACLTQDPWSSLVLRGLKSCCVNLDHCIPVEKTSHIVIRTRFWVNHQLHVCRWSTHVLPCFMDERCPFFNPIHRDKKRHSPGRPISGTRRLGRTRRSPPRRSAAEVPRHAGDCPRRAPSLERWAKGDPKKVGYPQIIQVRPWITGDWATPLKNDGVRQLGWWNSQYMEK